MPFKYQPQWQGPLSGRSFEKQTENFLNGIEFHVDEIISKTREFSISGEGSGSAHFSLESDVNIPLTVGCVADGSTERRQISSRFADIANVKDFGAAGDGITDDTAAIRGALDTGRSVFFPKGTYLVNGSLSITASQKIIGSGRGTTIIKESVAGDFLVFESGIKRCCVSCLTLTSTNVALKFIKLSGKNQYINFFDVEIIKSYDGINTSYGVYSAGTSGWNGLIHFFGCRFQFMTYGVYLQSTSTATSSTEFTFTSCDFNACRYGVYDEQHQDNSGAFRIVDCDFEAPLDGCNQIASISGTGCTVTCCRFETKKTGGWDDFVINDFTTHNPVHFGSVAKRNIFIGLACVPSSKNKQLLQENNSYTYISNTEGSRVFSRFGVHHSADDTHAVSIGYEQPDVYFDYNSKSASVGMSPTGSTAGRLQLKTSNGVIEFHPNGNRSLYVGNSGLFPVPTNTLSCGGPDSLFTEVYAATGSINVSDKRDKQFISSPSDSLMRAWSNVSFVVFKFRDAVESKGDAARVHAGVVAQQVRDAFASEGLDAEEYAFFCHDSWDDEWEEYDVVDVEAVLDSNGDIVVPAITHRERHLIRPAGDRYGIRYSEALALECAYQRWLGMRRDERIAALEMNR